MFCGLQMVQFVCPRVMQEVKIVTFLLTAVKGCACGGGGLCGRKDRNRVVLSCVSQLLSLRNQSVACLKLIVELQGDSGLV